MGQQHNFRVAILASGDRETGGGGSTMEAFVRNCALGLIAVEVGLVICNNSRQSVPGLYKRVEKLNKEFGLDLEVAKINGLTHPAAEGEELEPGAQSLAEAAACAEAIAKSGADLFLLAGFMKRVGDLGLKGLNTHPGPLPLTKGKHGEDVQQKVLDEGFPYSAHTVHEVDAEYDSGDIVAWRPVLVQPGDTAEPLFDRVQAVEKACLPGDVERYLLQQGSL